MMRTVKISNDRGVGLGTKVIDIETGREIPGVQSFSIECGGCNESITANLQIVLAEMDVEARARVVAIYADDTGRNRLREVAKIIWADGGVTDFD